MYDIPFNKPFIVGRELEYIREVVRMGKISGNGAFTQKVHSFFENRYSFRKCLLTSSCTDALEMAALLLDIKPGDEVIMPAYTFVSTANAFILRGAKIVFADSLPDHPNMDVESLKPLITKRTKAIIAVHYGGQAVQMEELMAICNQHDLVLVEDAAQAIESTYKGRPLGTFGELACFSFHETKNVISGEGGLLAINSSRFIDRAEVIWEKGTNRAAFGRGEVNKYNWVDIGSSFLPSELNAAYLYAQLECIEKIQRKRMSLWKRYEEGLSKLQEAGLISLNQWSENSGNNAHLYYILCKSEDERARLIQHLKEKRILAVFHYLALHESPYFKEKHDGRALMNAERFTKTLLRLPLYYTLSEEEQSRVIHEIISFYTTTS